MEIALEKLAIEERISLVQKILDSLVVDSQKNSELNNIRDLDEYNLNYLSQELLKQQLLQAKKELSDNSNKNLNASKWDDWFANGRTVTEDFMTKRTQPEQIREF